MTVEPSDRRRHGAARAPAVRRGRARRRCPSRGRASCGCGSRRWWATADVRRAGRRAARRALAARRRRADRRAAAGRRRASRAPGRRCRARRASSPRLALDGGAGIARRCSSARAHAARKRFDEALLVLGGRAGADRRPGSRASSTSSSPSRCSTGASAARTSCGAVREAAVGWFPDARLAAAAAAAAPLRGRARRARTARRSRTPARLLGDAGARPRRAPPGRARSTPPTSSTPGARARGWRCSNRTRPSLPLADAPTSSRSPCWAKTARRERPRLAALEARAAGPRARGGPRRRPRRRSASPTHGPRRHRAPYGGRLRRRGALARRGGAAPRAPRPLRRSSASSARLQVVVAPAQGDRRAAEAGAGPLPRRARAAASRGRRSAAVRRARRGGRAPAARRRGTAPASCCCATRARACAPMPMFAGAAGLRGDAGRRAGDRRRRRPAAAYAAALRRAA